MRNLRIIFVISIIAYVVFDFFNDADRDESGSIVSGGEIGVFAMRTGDCFDDPQEIIDAGSATAEFQDVAGVPCSEPHDNEVYAVFDVSFDRFPGEGVISGAAEEGCLGRFESFVGRSYDSSILDIFPIYPTDDSWSRLNDREVICAVYHMEGDKLTGSKRSSGI